MTKFLGLAGVMIALSVSQPAIAEEYRYLEEKNTAFIDEVFYRLGDDADIRLTKSYIDRGWEYCNLRDQGISHSQIVREQAIAVTNSGLNEKQRGTMLFANYIIRSAATEYLCTEYSIDD